MSHILVTGATGFVGKHLIRKLNKKNFNVVALVRNTSDLEIIDKYKLNSNIEIYDANYKSIEKIFIEYEISAVIHLASISTYSYEINDIKKIIASNIELGTYILEAMKKFNCCHLINTSSYWQNYSPKNPKPICLYAATKSAFENIIDFYCLNSKLNVISLKLYDVYGYDDHRNKIISILKKLKDNSEIDMSLGEQKLNMTFIDDIIEGYLVSLEILKKLPKNNHMKYSLYGNEDITLKEIINFYKKITGKKIKVNWGKLDYYENQIMCPSKEKKLPGWNQKISFDEGLKKSINL